MQSCRFSRLLPFTHELFFSFKLPCELLLFCVEQGILEVNFATQDNPQSWLRENTLFTKLFAAYAKYLSFFFFFYLGFPKTLPLCHFRSYTTGRIYLKAALKEPVMAVLEDDSLNLEIEPVKVYNSLSPAKRTSFGLTVVDATDGTALAEHPAMRQILGKGGFFQRPLSYSLFQVSSEFEIF